MRQWIIVAILLLAGGVIGSFVTAAAPEKTRRFDQSFVIGHEFLYVGVIEHSGEKFRVFYTKGNNTSRVVAVMPVEYGDTSTVKCCKPKRLEGEYIP